MTRLKYYLTSELLPIENRKKHCVCLRFHQWYQWYTNIVQGSTNGTIGNTISTNGNDNGAISSSNGTIGTIGNGTIGKPMVENPERSHYYFTREIANRRDVFNVKAGVLYTVVRRESEIEVSGGGD